MAQQKSKAKKAKVAKSAEKQGIVQTLFNTGTVPFTVLFSLAKQFGSKVMEASITIKSFLDREFKVTVFDVVLVALLVIIF